jgi:putative sterol carrier protein
VTDATTKFFEELGKRGTEPLVSRAKGAVRFELLDGRRKESWLVRIDRGAIAVSRDGGHADLVVRGERKLFDEIAVGKVNVVAARLRGAIHTEGDLRLAVLLQRLFPAPPRSRRGKDTTVRKLR